ARVTRDSSRQNNWGQRTSAINGPFGLAISLGNAIVVQTLAAIVLFYLRTKLTSPPVNST
ncbi:MAG: hypothetical protein KDB03_25345, partial [Planctomycetales bacterium]|nr:hypothetical protein [Planctomycetales bacterium]